MERSEWIAIIAIIVSVAIGLPGLLFQWLTYKSTKPSETLTRKSIPQNTTFEWKIPKWLMRLVIFIIQTVAIHFVVLEYSNPEPATRQSIIFIASMIGVFVLCFTIPLILNVYDYIESLSISD